MADEGVVGVYNNNAIADSKKTPFSIKVGMAQMLRGGDIIEVLNSEQAKIAESAGACSVLISQRSHHPNAVYRMSEPSVIKEIKTGSLNPVMAKARVGHFVEAQILEAIGVDYIDESEVLTIADDENFINKHKLTTPFVCGCNNLGQALNRIREGAAMLRTQGDLTSGNICKTVRNVMSVGTRPGQLGS